MVRDLQRAARIAFFAFFAAAAVRPQSAPAPLPLDPLTPEERQAASSIAYADARVSSFLGSGRNRQIYADFISVKWGSASDQPSGRYADVLFYRYVDDLGIRALVDLTAGAVLDVAHVNGESVPITTEEVQEAANLALADPRVAQLFGGTVPPFVVATGPATEEDLNTNRIEGLRTVASSTEDPCFQHRCIVLFFRMNNRYVHMDEVVVDLTTQTVNVGGGAQ
ncbi:MAG TPA: hypothetical protein VHC97_11790 [Thermoanaerobaculia bacterium]|jgi:hypothetical protein|nr:hypothetical protein [Thermoanaerobaculia bacterium]